MGIKEKMVIDAYQVDKILPQGQGGMGVVVIAHPYGGDINEKVALKISKADSNVESNNAALNSEVNVLKQLSHPNIVRILQPITPSKYDMWVSRAFELPNNPHFFAMEYLPGRSLAAYIRGSRGLPENIAATIIYKIAEALAFIHQSSFAYRDIKPENIMFRNVLIRGIAVEPVLIDFGAAASVKKLQDDHGTLAYMPPERLAKSGYVPNEVPVDWEKVDVYGLGVVLFEALTGKLPFGGFTKNGLTSAILHHVISPPRHFRNDISVNMERLVLKLLSLDAADRPNLEGLKLELQPFLMRPNILEVDIPLRQK